MVEMDHPTAILDAPQVKSRANSATTPTARLPDNLVEHK
jgi:hypothetical protein